MRGMLGRTLRIEARLPEEEAIVLGTFDSLAPVVRGLAAETACADGAYRLKASAARGHRLLLIAGCGERGVLYGSFALLRHIALHHEIEHLDERQSPSAPVRWTNEWDNLDGSIERGYGGRSIFFENGHVAADLTRAAAYARLLASVGINGCVVNNVNSNPRILESAFLPELARIAAAFRPWGVRMAIAVPFGSPKSVGGLDAFDPLDPRVAEFWKRQGRGGLPGDPGSRRLPREGRLRRAGRPIGLWPHARGRGQCYCARDQTARRPPLLPRLRLRPPHGLAQSRRTIAREPPTTISARSTESSTTT